MKKGIFLNIRTGYLVVGFLVIASAYQENELNLRKLAKSSWLKTGKKTAKTADKLIDSDDSDDETNCDKDDPEYDGGLICEPPGIGTVILFVLIIVVVCAVFFVGWYVCETKSCDDIFGCKKQNVY